MNLDEGRESSNYSRSGIEDAVEAYLVRELRWQMPPHLYQLAVTIEGTEEPTVLKTHDDQNDDRYRKCLASPNLMSVDQSGRKGTDTYHIYHSHAKEIHPPCFQEGVETHNECGWQ